MKSTTVSIDTQIASLLIGFEVAQYKHTLPHILECFHFFQLSHTELSTLEAWKASCTHLSPTLKESAAMLVKVKKLIADLSPLNMTYFQHVNRAHQVVDFFRTQTDFEKKFDAVSENYRSQPYALGKLNNMFAVFEMLDPFIRFLQGISFP